MRIVDVGAVVIEGRERADDAAHDRHRMRIAAEAPVEIGDLLVQHGVPRERVVEDLELVLGRQVAVQQQVANLRKGRMLRPLLDPVAAVQQDALIAVDEGDLRFGAACCGEAGIVGEVSGIGIKLADVDDPRADCAAQNWQIDRFVRAVVDQCDRVLAGYRLDIRFRLTRPRSVF
jgi:hypothetical protein